MTHTETIRRGVAAMRRRYGAPESWRCVRVRVVPEPGRPGWWMLRVEQHYDAWVRLGPLALRRRSRRRLLADAAAWAGRVLRRPRA